MVERLHRIRAPWSRLRRRLRSGSARLRQERGQSLVETAVVLPILLLLLAVVIDAARAFDATIVLANAVRQGARYASLEPNPPETEIVNMVVADIEGSGTNVSHMSDFGDYGKVTLEVADGVAVTVTAAYSFDLWFGGVLGLNTWQLERSGVMRHTETAQSP